MTYICQWRILHFGDRRVQEMERVLSSRFPVVEIEHTAKPFAALNWPYGAKNRILTFKLPHDSSN
jgi:hypothetical protein